MEEEGELIDESERSLTNQRIEKQVLGKHAKELVTRLQLLGDYEGLLTPPQSVISVAKILYGLLVSWKNRLISVLLLHNSPPPLPQWVLPIFIYFSLL